MKKETTTEIKIKCWGDQCAANYDSLEKLPKGTKKELKWVLELLIEELKG